jgi:uncharacterized OB-fold protein
MTGTVETFTTIHVGLDGQRDNPYAVVVVDLEGERVCARAEGDLSWLGVGAATRFDGHVGRVRRAVPASFQPKGSKR